MDTKEGKRRKPAKRPHRQAVGMAVVKGKLFAKVIQREERVDRIETLLVFAAAALHLTVVSGRVWTDPFMLDVQVSSRFLKQGDAVTLAVGKAAGKLKAVAGLDTFHSDSPAGVPLHQSLLKVCRGVDGLLRTGRQKAEPGELVHSSILERTQPCVSHIAARRGLPIHLDSLAGIGHLLIGLWDIGFFFFSSGYIPSLRITRNRLSGRRVSPCCLRRCHSSIKPRLGFRRRISRISFHSASVR